MKIYIASSWKMEKRVIAWKKVFQSYDHEVDAFCDSESGRYVFHWTELVDNEKDLKNFNALTFLADQRTQKAFLEDKKWLDWAECCFLILPSGRSAHLEAGYAVGQGKKLIIWQDAFPQGEFDVMYGFADLVTDQYGDVVDFVNGVDP